MPVVTRSQYHKNRDSGAYEQHCIRVDINSDNKRVVFLTTPEKCNTNIECPATPKAPRANKKVYPSFGNIARCLDFTESQSKRPQYPLNYRNFIIANKFQKVKVDTFLEMIDGFVGDIKFKTKNTEQMSIRTNEQHLTGLSNEELLDMAKSLNANTKFWDIFVKYSEGETALNPIIYEWSKLLCSILILYLSRSINNINKISFVKYGERPIYIIKHIIPVLIRFKDIFISTKFATFATSRRFLGAVIRKMLEFAEKGFVHSLLVIGEFYPEMVTKECYPYINAKNNADIYFQTFAEMTTNTDPDIAKSVEKYQSIFQSN